MLTFRTPQTAVRTMLLVLVVCLAGCGDRQTGIYDTANNPDGYPAMAVDLIKNIESGQLVGGPAIIDGFGQLYTEHSELLDEPGWTEIIRKLGHSFATSGDSLAALGPSKYTLAAEYYQLASFALPADTQIHSKTTAFDCWHRVAESPDNDLTPLTEGSSDLRAVLDAIRPFALSDKPSFLFLKDYLIEPVRHRLHEAGQFDPGVVAGLPPCDRALASFCGLIDEIPAETVVRFENPPVDVRACRVRRIGAERYSAEAYFVPELDTPRRLAFGLELLTVDSNGTPVQLQSPFAPHEWKTGQLQAAGRDFRFDQPVLAVSLALADATDPPARLVGVAGRNDGLWPLTVEQWPTDSLK